MATIALGLFCACGIASAACDVSTYDRTPPPAIKSEVNNAGVHFEWASDVDEGNGRLWVWHYVKNKHPNRSLGVRWEKGNIRRHLSNPLAPGETDCHKFFANAVNERPDDDAPIVYGTYEQRQDAAGFVRKAQLPPPPGRKGETISIIDTSFALGKVQDVRVVVVTQRTEKGFFLQIEQTPNVVVAMSALPQALSSEQFETLSRGFRDIPIARASFQQYTKLDAGKALAGMFSEKELVQRSKQDYVFFPRAPKVSVEIAAARLEELPADLIILDQKLQPLFATEITMLVPAKR